MSIDLEQLKQELKEISKWPPLSVATFLQRIENDGTWNANADSIKEAQFIAQAPERIAALIEEIERLQAINTNLESKFRRVATDHKD